MNSVVEACNQVGADSIWSLPDIWNSTISGFLVLIIPAFFRLVLIRPKLVVTNKDDLAIPSHPDQQISNILISQLRVKNTGLVTLTDPRIWCIDAKICNGDRFENYPMTPFELNWSDTDQNYQIGAMFPGNFNYRFNLFEIYMKSNTILIPRRDKDETKYFQIPDGVKLKLCLIISNDNFLVPAHFLELTVMKNPNNINNPVIVKINNQGDFVKERHIGNTQLFEWDDSK